MASLSTGYLTDDSQGSLDGARPSPNIWGHPDTYELENRAFDRNGRVWAAITEFASWTGRDVLDIGCGTGFHLPHFAQDARTVTGVEPHRDLAAIARRRVRQLTNVQVLKGLAGALPVTTSSIDFVHARWAYFFGPGCEPGLAELNRVMRPGGFAVLLDNDPTRSTFGTWFRRGFPEVDPEHIETFWKSLGWERLPVLTAWEFDTRQDLEDVVRIELPPEAADYAIGTVGALDEVPGLTVGYAVNLWWRQY